LLGGSRDVSVTVLNSHTSESGLLNLDGDASGQVHADLGFLCWVHSWVGGSGEDVESLVSDFKDHLYLILINKIVIIKK